MISATARKSSLALTAMATAAVLAMAALAAPAQADDQIYDLDGRVMATGTITNMTPNAVVISGRAGDKSVAANEIQKIVFDEDTGETRTVKTRVLSGQLEQAMKDFAKVNVGAIQRPELRADMEYYRAYCLAELALQGSGDKNAAASALFSFIKGQNRSYHLYDASRLMGHVSKALGKYDFAETYYGYLSKSPWPAMQLEGTVLVAGASLAAENYAKAATQYDAVIQHAASDAGSQRQKQFARLGKAYCLGKSGTPDEGLKLVDAVIKDESSQDGALFGRAYNAKGVCYLAMEKKKEALWAFLHTSLMFPTDPDAHAESLFQAAKLWDDRDNSEEALKLRALLKQRYSSSSWANK